MNRTDIINAVARKIGAQSYLEIGVRNPADNFDRVEIPRKVGIDIKPLRADIAKISSDAFFSFVVGEFDLIFIDGDHGYEQVLRDLQHAVKALAPGGAIIMHDVLPESAKEAAPQKPADGSPWCGGAWAAAAAWLLSGRPGYVIPVDHGVAVLQPADRDTANLWKWWVVGPPAEQWGQWSAANLLSDCIQTEVN